MGYQSYKACVSPSCQNDTDDDHWEVAGINARGKVEWWCPECALKQEASFGSIMTARIAWANAAELVAFDSKKGHEESAAKCRVVERV